MLGEGAGIMLAVTAANRRDVRGVRRRRMRRISGSSGVEVRERERDALRIPSWKSGGGGVPARHGFSKSVYIIAWFGSSCRDLSGTCVGYVVRSTPRASCVA